MIELRVINSGGVIFLSNICLSFCFPQQAKLLQHRILYELHPSAAAWGRERKVPGDSRVPWPQEVKGDTYEDTTMHGAGSGGWEEGGCREERVCADCREGGVPKGRESETRKKCRMRGSVKRQRVSAAIFQSAKVVLESPRRRRRDAPSIPS